MLRIGGRSVRRRFAALALAAAAVLVYASKGKSEPLPEQRLVVVAAHDLDPGRKIEARDLERRELVSPPGDVVTDPNLAAGRSLRIPLLEGEPLIERKFSPPGTEGISALVPPGMVAISFKPSSQIVARAGELVLVTATLDSSKVDTRGNPFRVVAEKARVISVDGAVAPETLTVAMTPQERSYLAAAQTMGSVDAALTNPAG